MKISFLTNRIAIQNLSSKRWLEIANIRPYIKVFISLRGISQVLFIQKINLNLSNLSIHSWQRFRSFTPILDLISQGLNYKLYSGQFYLPYFERSADLAEKEWNCMLQTSPDLRHQPNWVYLGISQTMSWELHQSSIDSLQNNLQKWRSLRREIVNNCVSGRILNEEYLCSCQSNKQGFCIIRWATLCTDISQVKSLVASLVFPYIKQTCTISYKVTVMNNVDIAIKNIRRL